MAEIPFHPDGDQSTNQPNLHETSQTSREDIQPGNRGFFKTLQEKVKQIKTKDRPLKPLKLKLFGLERSKLVSMNRILDLPVEHQYGALSLLYREARRKGDPDSVHEKTLGPSMQRIEVDQFACSVETDPTLKSAAEIVLDERANTFKESIHQKGGSVYQVDQPYESLDTIMFSPQVAQSRDVCLTMLQSLSLYSGGFIRSSLVEFDKSGYWFSPF